MSFSGWKESSAYYVYNKEGYPVGREDILLRVGLQSSTVPSGERLHVPGSPVDSAPTLPFLRRDTTRTSNRYAQALK